MIYLSSKQAGNVDLCRSVGHLFSLLCTEDPGTECVSLVWRCGRSGIWLDLRTKTQDSRTTYKQASSALSRTQVHFSSHSIASGLGSHKGVGFTSGIREGGGGHSIRGPLHCLFAVETRCCETPTLRRYTNIGAICRGGFNPLQSNDWLFSLQSLQDHGQCILSVFHDPHPIPTLTPNTQKTTTTPKINIAGVYFWWLKWPLGLVLMTCLNIWCDTLSRINRKLHPHINTGALITCRETCTTRLFTYVC